MKMRTPHVLLMGYFVLISAKAVRTQNASAAEVTRVGPSITLNPWEINATSGSSLHQLNNATTTIITTTTTAATTVVTETEGPAATTTSLPGPKNGTVSAPETITNNVTSGNPGSTGSKNGLEVTTGALQMTGTTPGPAVSNCSVNVSTNFCSNGGYCYENSSRIWCGCSLGWTGEHCETDVNECDSTAVSRNKCDPHADCLNTQGGYNCSCRAGHVGNGFTCSFVNLCSSSPCPGGVCISEINSYKCLCYDGYKGVTCNEDVNECESGNNVCPNENSYCTNTFGSYSCNCKSGYHGNASIECTENRIWPFGATKNLNSKMMIDVPGGFPFYGQIYYQIQVSVNGFVTFGPNQLKPYSPLNYRSQFPTNATMIAAYWSDIEVSSYNDSMVAVDIYEFWNTTLNLTSSDIRMRIGNSASQVGIGNFDPWFGVVVTWNKVSPYPAKIYGGWENATFQVVLATNGTQSVAIINYASKEMLWNRTSDNRTIVIGIMDSTGIKYNYTGDVYRPDLAIGNGTGKPGQFVFRLGQQQLTNNHLPCLKWYQSPRNSGNSQMLAPCPCSLDQALNDRRFVNEGTNCVRHRMNTDAGVNVCCYDSDGRALVVGLDGGYLKLNGGAEIEGKTKCCEEADLCHLFYMKQPADNCMRYVEPSIGAVWGDPYILTLLGEDFVFNGKGEFSLLRLTNGLFWLQGRFEPNSKATNLSLNATSLTAIVLKSGNLTLEVQLQLSNGNLRLFVGGHSQPYPLPWDGKLSGVIMESPDSKNFLMHLDNDIIVQLSVVMDILRLTVLVPKSLPGWKESSGLLMKKCLNSYPTGASDAKLFDYFTSCMATPYENLFMHTMDGYEFEKINSNNFPPPFTNSFLNNSAALAWCGTSISCLREYAKTNSRERSESVKTFEDKLSSSRVKLANYPPEFGANHMSVLYAVVGLELNITLNVSDPEERAVHFRVDTVINETEWELVDNFFMWTPSMRKYNMDTSTATAFLRFYATDDSDVSSLYWPYVHLCPCSADKGRCSYMYPSKLDQKIPKGRLLIGRCTCNPGWSGEFCDQQDDVCDPNPCFPGVNCTGNPMDMANGYNCASCPSGFVRDGNWCYDMNECLTPAGLGCSSCTNLLGTYICSCDSGYVLSKDRKTCIDVDECAGGDKCNMDGQFCHNLPGKYECLCRPDYFSANGVCTYAPIKFGGKVTFKTFSVTPGRFLEWKDSMADQKTDNFKMIAQSVETLIQRPFVGVVSGFVGARTTGLQKGSIQANFDLYFRPEAVVNATYLNGIIERFLNEQKCELGGPDCTLNNLIGVDVNTTNVYDKDYCVNPSDNSCDLETMNCLTLNGMVQCTCKDGFKRVSEYVDACEDIDECLLNVDDCYMNMSICVNTPGSYHCSCVPGYEMNNGTCTDICTPNPCANSGICILKGEEFLCDCVGIWSGLNCTEENPEAIKFRNAVIGVAVGLGVLCIALIVAVIVTCMRSGSERPTSAHPHQTQTATTKNGGVR